MKKIFLVLIVTFNYMYTINAQNPDFLFMVEQAIKAPSGHNTQPWLFKINDSSIELHPNPDKSLPVVDFDNRELFVSLGCATENLCIAASCKGYKTDVSINEEGTITIKLLQTGSATPDPLSEQIAVRQTNRSIYNGNIIPGDSIRILKAIPVNPGIEIHFYESGTAEFDTIPAFIYKGNRIQMGDEAFQKELRNWMRYNKKHQDETNDGLSYAVFGAPNLPKFIVKPIMAKAISEKSQNNGDRKKLKSASHLVLFTTKNNTVEDWINLGRSLERILLKSTEMGIAHSYFNQPNEIRELAEQMAESLNISGEYPTILIRLGYGEKMPYSKRKDAGEVIIN
jgi:hypothetical protein